MTAYSLSRTDGGNRPGARSSWVGSEPARSLGRVSGGSSVSGHADGRIYAAQRVFDDDTVMLPAQDQADAWVLPRLALTIVERC